MACRQHFLENLPASRCSLSSTYSFFLLMRADMIDFNLDGLIGSIARHVVPRFVFRFVLSKSAFGTIRRLCLQPRIPGSGLSH